MIREMTRLVPALLLILLSLAAPAPLAAQTTAGAYPAFAPRAFVMFSQQQFAAKETFEAIFGESTGSFRGGGVDVVIARNIFAEIGFARFEQTGERVFPCVPAVPPPGSEVKCPFRLGIPLTAKIRSVEFVAGYRVTAWRRVLPYGGIGVGSHRYQESSEFAAAGDDVSVSASGLVLAGGVEVRLARFIGVTVDVRRSTIEEIIGSGGISKEFGENDLGGTAARFRIIIGR